MTAEQRHDEEKLSGRSGNFASPLTVCSGRGFTVIHGEDDLAGKRKDDPLDLSINDHSKINHGEGGAIRDSNSDSGLPSNGTQEGRIDGKKI
ncbi:hypothetical protein CEXT_793541 [Caerostris extrusa]|uniref:Uncharacterized protein n=1 Tax=Caerostris extrusa TaxID=172846 RepID=A0AAV4SSN3_CAEEX|nr:hypothetical protein CEXT_793541 [Caerostris extrusa]